MERHQADPPHRPARRRRRPLTTVIAAMVEPLGERRIDVRDRALLLIGFAGAFRRSELVALDVEDITDTDDGLRIAVRRSKADQEGEGAAVGLPYGSNPATCPVRAWRAWLEVSGITEGRRVPGALPGTTSRSAAHQLPPPLDRRGRRSSSRTGEGRGIRPHDVRRPLPPCRVRHRGVPPGRARALGDAARALEVVGVDAGVHPRRRRCGAITRRRSSGCKPSQLLGDSGRCHELPCMRPWSCGRRPERESVETAIAADTQVGASGKPGAARDITVDPYRCNA